MAGIQNNDQKTMSSLSRAPNHRVALTFAARGILDRDIQGIIDSEILKRGCTELDMSENLITQRGASILGDLLGINRVSQYNFYLSYVISHVSLRLLLIYTLLIIELATKV